MKKILILAASIAGLAGCNATKDAAYFTANPSERDTVLQECRKNTGAFNNDQTCIAAAMAEDVRPVSYWKANPADRQAKLGECKEYAGTLGKSANCANAQAAQVSAFGSGSNPIYVQGPKASSVSQ